MKIRPQLAYFAIALISAVLAMPSQAFELTYSSRGSSYEVLGTETAQDLLDEFTSSSPIYCDRLAMTEFTRVNSAVSCGSGNSDLDDLVELSFNLADDADFEFQLGTDWGRGGAVIVNNTLSYITTDDIWWGYDWNNADVISNQLSLTAGLNTIQWIGFEGCCNGDRSIRFSVNGGSFQALSEANMAAYEASAVPVPAGLLLMLSMLPLALRFRG
ncbi:MAG: CCXG family PEP-CTERM protein [Gammaproteobacteria bacterium]